MWYGVKSKLGSIYCANQRRLRRAPSCKNNSGFSVKARVICIVSVSITTNSTTRTLFRKWRTRRRLRKRRICRRIPPYSFPSLIAEITCAKRSSERLCNETFGLVSVSILPVNSWMCLLDQFSGSRLHNAKIMAVAFGAAFLWTTLRLTSTIFPSTKDDSVVVSSHSYPSTNSINERLQLTTNWESYHS